MQRVELPIIIILSSLITGCAANMSKSIEQRVDIGEQCRQALEDPLPDEWVEPENVASIHLGGVGSCAVGDTDGLLVLCSFDQIARKYSINFTKEKSSLISLKDGEAYKAFVEDLKSLLGALGEIDKNIKSHLTAFKTNKDPICLINAANTEAGDIRLKLDRLRSSLLALRILISEKAIYVGQEASVEFSAWDSNFRIQLDQLERLLAGDYHIVFQDAIKNQIVRHSARRSLDFLHNSLKPADVVINKLDDKAYGAVSVGYLLMGPNIQKGVDNAYAKINDIYRNRIKKSGIHENAIEPRVREFLTEIRRAACENLEQSSKFSMLTELLDSTLIRKIPDPDRPDNPTENPTKKAENYSPQAHSDMLFERYFGSYTTLNAVSTSNEGLKVSPLSVYIANEWAARQFLLMQKMEAKAKANRKQNDKGEVVEFPGVDTVDEVAVKQLAEAATAKSVDDAARSDPSLLDSGKVTSISQSLQQNVNVITAAYAVSQASAVLMANIGVSNTNTFNPINSIAPIINIQPYEKEPKRASFCVAGNFTEFGAICVMDGADYVVTFDQPNSYGTDSCSDSMMETVLGRLAADVSNYAAKYEMHFNASVSGYASHPKAMLANCPATAMERKLECSYYNRLKEKITVQGCIATPGKRDNNVVLSGARAKNAAKKLEKSGNGSILVKSLAAQGAVADISPGALPDSPENRTVIVRLQPVVWK